MVSPFAQYIVTQSVLNVMAIDQGRERFDSVPDEVRLYVRGGYGEIPGSIEPNLYDKITAGKEPIKERPGALLAPAIKDLKKLRGPFSSDDDLLLAAFYDQSLFNELKKAGPIDINYPLMKTPLLTLVKGISDRASIKSFHFVKKNNL